MPNGFCEGAPVRIFGLTNASHLNGAPGRLLNSTAGRWNVKLSDGSQKAIKPDNLVGLRPGFPVKICGLKGAPELNGCSARCQEWVERTGRWNVKLQDGQVKSLKPENLEDEEPADASSGKDRDRSRSPPHWTMGSKHQGHGPVTDYLLQFGEYNGCTFTATLRKRPLYCFDMLVKGLDAQDAEEHWAPVKKKARIVDPVTMQNKKFFVQWVQQQLGPYRKSGTPSDPWTDAICKAAWEGWFTEKMAKSGAGVGWKTCVGGATVAADAKKAA